MSTPSCCCCGTPMASGLDTWHQVCPRCGYEAAHFAASINEGASHERIDEAERNTGLKDLRQQNFRLLLEQMARHLPARVRLLDVGAAHGWFVQLALQRGWQALGLEPDRVICEQACADGMPVREGYFPDALREGEQFEVIVFNDVFEHIPDASAVLRACAARLAPGGLVVLNLPSTDGIFYRTARLLRRLGVGSFFDRLWQKGLPSPHLHYFNAANLALLGQAHGMACVHVGHLPSLHLKGLYPRIAYVKSGARWLAPLIWLAIVLAWPLLRLAPADIDVLILRRDGAAPDAG